MSNNSYKEPRDLSGNGDHTRPDLQLVLKGDSYWWMSPSGTLPARLITSCMGQPDSSWLLLMKGEAEKKAKYAAMAKTQQAQIPSLRCGEEPMVDQAKQLGS